MNRSILKSCLKLPSVSSVTSKQDSKIGLHSTVGHGKSAEYLLPYGICLWPNPREYSAIIASGSGSANCQLQQFKVSQQFYFTTSFQIMLASYCILGSPSGGTWSSL